MASKTNVSLSVPVEKVQSAQDFILNLLPDAKTVVWSVFGKTTVNTSHVIPPDVLEKFHSAGWRIVENYM